MAFYYVQLESFFVGIAWAEKGLYALGIHGAFPLQQIRSLAQIINRGSHAVTVVHNYPI
jgi:hypothetical protein